MVLKTMIYQSKPWLYLCLIYLKLSFNCPTENAGEQSEIWQNFPEWYFQVNISIPLFLVCEYLNFCV